MVIASSFSVRHICFYEWEPDHCAEDSRRRSYDVTSVSQMETSDDHVVTPHRAAMSGIDTKELIHSHNIKKVSIGTVRKRSDITVESRCAVCEIGINDANVPENCFLCNFCLGFYMCETCYKRKYQGKICPADTMIVAGLLDYKHEMDECSMCSREIAVRYSR